MWFLPGSAPRLSRRDSTTSRRAARTRALTCPVGPRYSLDEAIRRSSVSSSRAGIDRFGGGRIAPSMSRGNGGRDEAGGRVQHDDVAPGAGLTVEDGPDQHRVLLGRASGDVLAARRSQTQRGRIQSPLVTLRRRRTPARVRGPRSTTRRAHRGRGTRSHARSRDGRASRPSWGASAGPTRREPGAVAPAGLVRGPRKLKIVGMPSSPRRRPRVPHRGMEHRREAEADAGLGDAALDAVGRQIDLHAQRLEDVRRTRLATTPPGCRASRPSRRPPRRRAPRRSKR